MFRNLRAYVHALAKQARSLPTYLACPAGYETVPCCFCLTPFNRPSHLPTVDLCQRCEQGQDAAESNWDLAHLSDAQAMAAGPSDGERVLEEDCD